MLSTLFHSWLAYINQPSTITYTLIGALRWGYVVEAFCRQKSQSRLIWRTTPNWLNFPQILLFLGILFTSLLRSWAYFHAIASGNCYLWPSWPVKMLWREVSHVPQGLPQLWALGEPDIKYYSLNQQSTRCCPADSLPLQGGLKTVEGHAENYLPQTWKEKDFWEEQPPCMWWKILQGDRIDEP